LSNLPLARGLWRSGVRWLVVSKLFHELALARGEADRRFDHDVAEEVARRVAADALDARATVPRLNLEPVALPGGASEPPDRSPHSYRMEHLRQRADAITRVLPGRGADRVSSVC